MAVKDSYGATKSAWKTSFSKIVEPLHVKNYGDSTSLGDRYKLKILAIASVILATGTSAFFFVDIFLFKSFGLSQFSLAVMVGGFAYLFWYVVSTQNLKKASWGFTLFAFGVVAWRLFLTGGIASPGVFAYVGYCVCVYTILGERMGRVALAMSTLTLILLGALEPYLNLSSKTEGFHPYLYGWVDIMMLLLVVLPVMVVIDEKDRMYIAYCALEKKSISHLVMRRVNHEMGNSLAVSMGLLELYKLEKDPRSLDRMQTVLLEAKDLIAVLERGGRAGELAKTLENHRYSVKLMKDLKSKGFVQGNEGEGRW